MPRSLLGLRPVGTANKESVALSSPAPSKLTGPALVARLRRKRTAAYVSAVSQLDAGGHLHDPATAQAVADAIRNEMGDISVDSLPIGIVARCYLGAPYEVHTLDVVGGIIKHYKSNEGLPTPLERARALAQHQGYAFIEVYAERLIAVSKTGQTAVMDL